MKDLEFFKLEERVLFEAAAVAEIVEAADAASQTQESSIHDILRKLVLRACRGQGHDGIFQTGGERE